MRNINNDIDIILDDIFNAITEEISLSFSIEADVLIERPIDRKVNIIRNINYMAYDKLFKL
jgi:hypothetical protein